LRSGEETLVFCIDYSKKTITGSSGWRIVLPENIVSRRGKVKSKSQNRIILSSPIGEIKKMGDNATSVRLTHGGKTFRFIFVFIKKFVIAANGWKMFPSPIEELDDDAPLSEYMERIPRRIQVKCPNGDVFLIRPDNLRPFDFGLNFQYMLLCND
jgi:hypothetical protein